MITTTTFLLTQLQRYVFKTLGATDTLMQVMMTQRVQDADSVVNQNNAINAILDFEGNEKIVNNIYLETIAKGTLSLKPGEIDTLESIAGQCPFVGGSAVFRARGLLSMVRDSVYDDEDICTPPGRPESLLKPESSGFMVFPNPAKNEVIVMLPEPFDGDSEIVIYNALGIPIAKDILPMRSTKGVLNTSELSGICLIVVYQKGKKVYTERLVIIH